MATSTHATNLIKEMKAVLKQFSDTNEKYYKKFVTESAVPTKSDIEAYAKHIKAMRAASKLMNADLGEVRQTIQFFGGPSDTIIDQADTLLETMQKHLPKN